MRMAKRTNTYRRQRRQAQMVYGLIAGGILAVTLQGRTSLAVVIGFTIIGGGIVAYAYGQFHDPYVVRHYRLMVGDLYPGVSTIRCVVDLRDDVVWTKTGDMEIAFPGLRGQSLTTLATLSKCGSSLGWSLFAIVDFRPMTTDRLSCGPPRSSVRRRRSNRPLQPTSGAGGSGRLETKVSAARGWAAGG